MGDSRASGAAERGVQVVGEQVRVLRRALGDRVGYLLEGPHPALAWLIEHAADILSKYLMGDDGKTAPERLTGKPRDKELVEFGEKVHYRFEERRGKENKLDVKWGEGFFLGVRWRTGEMIVGNAEGIHKASAIKRVGGHRRWDGGGRRQVRGLPWRWNPDSEEEIAEAKARYLREDELVGKAAPQIEDDR